MSVFALKETENSEMGPGISLENNSNVGRRNWSRHCGLKTVSKKEFYFVSVGEHFSCCSLVHL